MVDEGRVVRLFENLVKIYSPSYQERQVADYIKGYAESLGYIVFEDNAGERRGGDAGNLIVTVPATAEGPCVMFSAHMDTVEPSNGIEPVVEDGIIGSRGDTILGADDKAGCAAMLEVLTLMSEKAFPHGPVHLVFTIAEEIGLQGAKELDISDKYINYTYVLDSNGSVGTIVLSAPYQESFEVEFIGKSAHAGVDPENGINAIAAAAKAISCLKLGRIDDETTANVGTIEGGRAGNIVPERCRMFAECRSNDLKKFETQIHSMVQCFAQGAEEVGADVKIRRIRPYDGYYAAPEAPIIKRSVAAVERLGLTPNLIKSGGGSDANVFSKKGLNAVNLGVGFMNVHSNQEHVAVSELVNLSRLLIELARPE
ncbi:MAG TPA: M20/M25/M40 family metallo-hydrolase [Candidatus Aquicultor sp.]|jgi:tripeptide aminopeptidase